MAQLVAGRVELLGGLKFRGTNAAGHELVLASGEDAAAEGVSPMEAVLLALGGCTGIDVISTLRKMRQEVTAYQIHVRGERRDEHPRVFTRLVVEHVVTGRSLRRATVQRAIELSAGKYCSVSAMLEHSAEVTTVYRLVDTTTGAEETGGVTLNAR
jgi:putative redox protein